MKNRELRRGRIGWTCDQVKARRNLILGGGMSKGQEMALEAHIRFCLKCSAMVKDWRRKPEPPDDVA